MAQQLNVNRGVNEASSANFCYRIQQSSKLLQNCRQFGIIHQGPKVEATVALPQNHKEKNTTLKLNHPTVTHHDDKKHKS